MAEKPGAGGELREYDTSDGQYEKEDGEESADSNKGYDSRDDFKQTVERVNQTRRRNGIQDDTRDLLGDENNIHASPSEVFKFHRLDTKHHADHAREMGYKSMRDYETAAVDFFNSNKGKLYYSAARDRYYRYDEKTRYFCSASGDTVHTFKYVTKKEFYRKIKQDKLYEQ